jgi:hypothetical protein
MSGVWVKGTGYNNSSKRHFYESDEVTWTRPTPGTNWGVKWTEWMVGRSICSKRTEGHGMGGDGSAGFSPWRNRLAYNRGLSIKYEKDIKLTQANLCYYCKVRYIKARPALEAALKELGVI